VSTSPTCRPPSSGTGRRDQDCDHQAVTDGEITQAKADWLLEGLDAGYWGPGVKGAYGGDFGFGMGGHGGHGGPRGMGVPPSDAAPDSSTTPSSTN